MPYEVIAETTSAAPPETVFEHVAIAAAWAVWGGFAHSERERPGTGTPDGVGSVRRIRQGPGSTREEVVAYEPYRHYAYRLLSGVPMLGYRADVTFEPTAGGGTAIRWAGRFTAGKIPGTGPVLWLGLRVVVSYLATRVARHAERCQDPACPAFRNET
jgi:uncharacterized protein YndB with AHSA1/START domain